MLFLFELHVFYEWCSINSIYYYYYTVLQFRKHLKSFPGVLYNVQSVNLMTVTILLLFNKVCVFSFMLTHALIYPGFYNGWLEIMWPVIVFARLLRETVLSIACQMGDQEALNEASRIFDLWIDGSLRYHQSSGLLVVNFPYSQKVL